VEGSCIGKRSKQGKAVPVRKHYGINVYEGVEVQLHALDAGDLSPVAFPTEKGSHGTH
jgi:hypothetical protein